MRIDINTLFPDQVSAFADTSILGRARSRGALKIVTHDLRSFGLGKHQSVDDTPYGGGAGMLLRVDVVVPAIQAVKKMDAIPATVILLTPQGERFTQTIAEELSKTDRLILVAGHYEGFDERIRSYVDRQISIGDFVLTGGELPALMITDAVARLVPGVLTVGSAHEESHSLTSDEGERLLEYPQYTRPEEFDGQTVPDVLLSGNHATINSWRQDQAESRSKGLT
jgi:tRNA (guanine37-N1)-methyltransferase